MKSKKLRLNVNLLSYIIYLNINTSLGAPINKGHDAIKCGHNWDEKWTQLGRKYGHNWDEK